MVTCDGCQRSLCSLAELTLAVPQPHGDILVAAHPWSMRSVVTTLPDPNAFVCECGNPVGKKVSWDQLRPGSCEKGDYSQYSFAVLNLDRIAFYCNGEFIKLDTLELLRDSVIDETDGQLRSTALTEEQVLNLHHGVAHKKGGDDNGAALDLQLSSYNTPSPAFQPPLSYQPPFTYNAPASSDVRQPPYSEYACNTSGGNGILQTNDSSTPGCANASNDALLDYLRRTPTPSPVAPAVPRGPVGAPIAVPSAPSTWGAPLSTPNHFAINGLHAPPHIQHLKHTQSTRAHGSQVDNSVHSAAPVCTSAVAENDAYVHDDDAAASARGSAGNQQLGNDSGQLPSGVHLPEFLHMPEFLHLPEFFTSDYEGTLNEYDPDAEKAATVTNNQNGQRESEIIGEARMSSQLEFEDVTRVCTANESDVFETDGATGAYKWSEHGYCVRGNGCSALHSASDRSGKKKSSLESREDRASKDRFKPGPGNPKFKSRYCWNFVQNSCPYGSKCAFIHSLPGDATASDAAIHHSARGGSTTKDSTSTKNERKNTGDSNHSSKKHKDKKEKSDISSSSNISGGHTMTSADNYNGNVASATGRMYRPLRKTTANNSSSEPSSSSKDLHNGSYPLFPHRRVPFFPTRPMQRTPRNSGTINVGKTDAVTMATTPKTAASTNSTTQVSTGAVALCAKKKVVSATAVNRKDQPKVPPAAAQSPKLDRNTDFSVAKSDKAGNPVQNTAQDMDSAVVSAEDSATSSKRLALAEDADLAVRNAPQDAAASQKLSSTTEDAAKQVVEDAARKAATPARSTQLWQVDTPTQNASAAAAAESTKGADIDPPTQATQDGCDVSGCSASDGGAQEGLVDQDPLTEHTSGAKGTSAEGPKNTAKGGKHKHYSQYYGTPHARYHATYHEGYRKPTHVPHYGGEAYHHQQRQPFRVGDARFKQQRYRSHHVDHARHPQHISAGHREHYYDSAHGAKNNYGRCDQYVPNFNHNPQRVFTLQPPMNQSSKKPAKNEIGTMGPVKEATAPLAQSPLVIRPTRGKQHAVLCYFYSRDGKCTNGQMCKFAHVS